jgi:predicted nucleic acid-binding protein
LTPIILDVSVAAKWALPRSGEDLVEEALHLLERQSEGEVEFLVPDSFWAELGNVFWKAVRRGRWSEDEALNALDEMFRRAIQTVPSTDVLADALGIAIKYQRTVYDSLYVALAQQAGSNMITADERLVNALGSRFPVRWLGSFQQMH